MNANISTMPLWSIVFGIALSVPTDANADLVRPNLSTHAPAIVLLSDGPFTIDPEHHYLNVHSMTRASVFAISGSTSSPGSSGASGSGGSGAASGGGGGEGGSGGGTDAEHQALKSPADHAPGPLSLSTVITGHDIPGNWRSETVATPTAAIPQIPIPPAVVLFGSALLWLIGFHRRVLPRQSLSSKPGRLSGP